MQFTKQINCTRPQRCRVEKEESDELGFVRVELFDLRKTSVRRQRQTRDGKKYLQHIYQTRESYPE